MLVQDIVYPSEDVLENKGVDVGQGKPIFIEPQQQVPSVYCQVHKNPESVNVAIAKDEQVSNNKVDTLSVPHRGEVVGDKFEGALEEEFGMFLEIEGAVEIFFDLGKTVMIACLKHFSGGFNIRVLLSIR